MRVCEIKIVGIGGRKTGIGKNGKPYDFVQVAYEYEDDYYDGMNVGSCPINYDVIESNNISVGSIISVCMGYKDYRSFILSVL